MISRETILKLLALEARASIAPWHTGHINENHPFLSDIDALDGARVAEDVEDQNSIFIIHSRNHIKDLCDSYLKLLDENEKGRELLKQSINVIQHGGPFVIGDKIQKFLKEISE